jgi:hypothetical protein
MRLCRPVRPNGPELQDTTPPDPSRVGLDGMAKPQPRRAGLAAAGPRGSSAWIGAGQLGCPLQGNRCQSGNMSDRRLFVSLTMSLPSTAIV